MLSINPIRCISWNSIGSSYSSIIDARTAFILNPARTCTENINNLMVSLSRFAVFRSGDIEVLNFKYLIICVELH